MWRAGRGDSTCIGTGSQACGGLGVVILPGPDIHRSFCHAITEMDITSIGHKFRHELFSPRTISFSSSLARPRPRRELHTDLYL
ncbi:hypothetical protein PoB_001347900 [Plakobranchus ocellatus]|uniref:Uncharacterized protein n=1 Tax=Plakobranchus ocellatus TaxID=259542 RepID=A0AAV3YXY7_9GAST|nr:hypothetical protein PoB_001347900 [Plakobranchus ocellatus]